MWKKSLTFPKSYFGNIGNILQGSRLEYASICRDKAILTPKGCNNLLCTEKYMIERMMYERYLIRIESVCPILSPYKIVMDLIVLKSERPFKNLRRV